MHRKLYNVIHLFCFYRSWTKHLLISKTKFVLESIGAFCFLIFFSFSNISSSSNNWSSHDWNPNIIPHPDIHFYIHYVKRYSPKSESPWFWNHVFVIISCFSTMYIQFCYAPTHVHLSKFPFSISPLLPYVCFQTAHTYTAYENCVFFMFTSHDAYMYNNVRPFYNR